METLLWFFTGILAAEMEYWLGIGFGLGASLIMIVIAGEDPRLVASTIALTQLIMTPLALSLQRRVGNLDLDIKDPINLKLILSLSLSSTLSIMTTAILVKRVNVNVANKLFSLSLIILAILILMNNKQNIAKKNHLPLSVVLGMLGGMIKTLVGGGYTLVIVLAQKLLGIDVRNSISLTPLIKVLPFSLLVVVYSLSGYFNVKFLVATILGSLLGMPIAANLLKETSKKLENNSYYSYSLIVILIVSALIKVI